MKYTDEDLERARLFALTIFREDCGRPACELLAQLIADVRAEAERERDAALLKVGEVWLERNRAVRERDEARRVARSLADWLIDNPSCEDLDDPDLRSALAYPEEP